MNFLLIDQTLRTVLNTISGISVGIAQDAGQSQFFPQMGVGPVTDGHGNAVATGTNNEASITYEVISAMGVGWDEWRDRYDPNVHPVGDTYPGNLGSMITTSTGNRELHVQIKCECFDGGDGAIPFGIIERVRTAIGLPSVVEMLNTAGLAIQSCEDTITKDYDDDNGRRVGVAILEIIFNAADGIDDIPQTTIEIIDRPALTVYGLVTG